MIFQSSQILGWVLNTFYFLKASCYNAIQTFNVLNASGNHPIKGYLHQSFLIQLW